MTGKTLTRVDLYEAVYRKIGLPRSESVALVELVLKEITDCLERGETVKLSSFGSSVWPAAIHTRTPVGSGIIAPPTL